MSQLCSAALEIAADGSVKTWSIDRQLKESREHFWWVCDSPEL